MRRKLIVLLLIFLFMMSCQSKVTEEVVEEGKIEFFRDEYYNYGCKDSDGKIILEPIIQILIPSKQELMPFYLDGFWGYINHGCEIIIQPQYDNATEFSEDMAAVVFDSNFQYDFNKLYEDCHSDDDCMYYKYTSLKEDSFKGHWGYIFKNGKFVIEPQFDNAGKFSNGLAPVEKNGRWGFIDIYGKYKIEPRFSNVKQFIEGLAAVKNANSKWGFIDSSGKYVITPLYGGAGSFSQGYAPARDGLWGYIDKQGEYVIEPQFVDAREFDERGWARVEVYCHPDAKCRTTFKSIQISDYIKEDNLFIKLLSNTLGERASKKAKSFLVNFSEKKALNTLFKLLFLIIHLIIWTVGWSVIFKLFPQLEKSNNNSEVNPNSLSYSTIIFTILVFGSFIWISKNVFY